MSPSARLLTLMAALAVVGCTTDTPAAPATSETTTDHASAHASQARGGNADQAHLARQLAELRRVTAPYHNFDRKGEGGYTEQITPCWEHNTLGAMGYHYGNPEFINGTVNLLEPELLMYEPGPGGQMRLVGLEYIVPIDLWEGAELPTLLGQTFHPHSELPIYKLHIWLWRDNPRGMFADWNPRVSCDHAEETEYFG